MMQEKYYLNNWKLVIYIYLSLICTIYANKDVCILYNNNLPKSKKLAHYYAETRNIPKDNIIGYPYTSDKTCSWEEYQKTHQLFSAIKEQVNTITVIKGVPFKINTKHKTAFDSQLTGTLFNKNRKVRNPYYKSNKLQNIKAYIVGRIDGPTWENCYAIINDSIYAESYGLKGKLYVDLSKIKKFKSYDNLFETVATENKRFKLKLEKTNKLFQQKLTNIAFYYGWYSSTFSNNFEFNPGSIAYHLHSFSAQDIHSTKKHWVGGLVDAGATVTLGTVYEPYLHTTHDCYEFHNAILNGKSAGEAALIASPYINWQSLMIGDPLYTPFKVDKLIK